MLAGPVFAREVVITPRRLRHFIVYRMVYVSGLLLLMCTAWLVLVGMQQIRNVGDMARFGSSLFQIPALVQLGLIVFLSALGAAGAVSQEKDRRTLILLLLTRLTNSELVVGKLLAGLLNVFVMLATALPVFLLIPLFGGVSFGQVARVFAVTFGAALTAGSLASTFALWREKTFQALSATALALLLWLAVGEVLHSGLVLGEAPLGIAGSTWAAAISPLRATQAAARPLLDTGLAFTGGGVAAYLLFSVCFVGLLNLVAIARVRVWNPSREVRPGQQEDSDRVSIWGTEHDSQKSEFAAEAARAGHVDALGRAQKSTQASRRVWDNPILWRETRTRAYGRKVLVIKLVYVLLGLLTTFGLLQTFSTSAAQRAAQLNTVLPESAKPLAPFFLVSLVIVNALAVTSVTNERDGQALDLLLVTDLSPKEFVFGKLGGVLWVTKEMVLLPLLLVGYLWWRGGLGRGWEGTENLVFTAGGLTLLNVFVCMLGIHCGMNYANSRAAIGMSLGTVFFLFLGVATCMVMMISFSGSFQTQLPPFLAMVLGGGVGLFLALGSRNPSPAILTASIVLPFATFFAITSFVLRDRELTVFLVTTAAYGFTTAAMLIPALNEFDIAMGRTKTAADD